MIKNRIIVILGLLALISGCATSNINPGGTANLDELQQIRAPYASRHHHHHSAHMISNIRIDAIKQTALSLGARSALAWRSKRINHLLMHEENTLNTTYDFYGIMLPHNVLPPVLVEAQNILNLDSPDTLRLSQKTYKIIEQAHFVTAPPTWRNYIWLNFPEPTMPDNTLLPKNPTEQQIWNEYVERGWNSGIQQANNIFAADINRLKRDYNGMVLYKKLYAENRISAPYVAKTNLGITGNGSQVHIDDRVLRITSLSQLNLKSNQWRAVVVPNPIGQRRISSDTSQSNPPSSAEYIK